MSKRPRFPEHPIADGEEFAQREAWLERFFQHSLVPAADSASVRVTAILKAYRAYLLQHNVPVLFELPPTSFQMRLLQRYRHSEWVAGLKCYGVRLADAPRKDVH